MYVYSEMPEQREPIPRPPRGPHQLPPGRTRLSRGDVEANQKQRIFDAIVDVVSLAGFASMGVQDIIATAGVSRRTFYDHYRSKDEAFLAAVEQVADQLVQRVTTAFQAADTFPGSVRDGLAAFLQFLADEPRYADLIIVEILAAGPVALSHRNRVMNSFATMVKEGAKRHPTARRPPDIAAETIVGGIYEVVFARILEGQAAELPDLLPDLSYALIQPYLGDEAARRESVKPANLYPNADVAA